MFNSLMLRKINSVNHYEQVKQSVDNLTHNGILQLQSNSNKKQDAN